MSRESFARGYIACALWAESANTTDTDDRSIGDVAELSDEARDKLTAEANAFFAANFDLLARAYLEHDRDDEHLGHDFWLTRNGHGTGFWDRGMGAVGDALHAATKAYGQRDLYLGDDGLIYQFPH